MESQTAVAERSVVHTPAYRRLNDEKRIAILKLHRLGKTQVEIAQVIGCDQPTVSRWLSQCQDTTEHATTYLRGSALQMARNIVQKGRAADHIKTLEGINVLQPVQQAGLTVVVGGNAQDVKVAVLVQAQPTFASDSSEVSEGG